MSRRARSVDVWAAMRSLGRSGLAELIERCCRHATRFADGLRAAGYPVLNDVVLNQVLVSFGDADTTDAVISAIQQDGACWCGGTTWHGQRRCASACRPGRPPTMMSNAASPRYSGLLLRLLHGHAGGLHHLLPFAALRRDEGGELAPASSARAPRRRRPGSSARPAARRCASPRRRACRPPGAACRPARTRHARRWRRSRASVAATGGTSGAVALGCVLVTASARKVPALACGQAKRDVVEGEVDVAADQRVHHLAGAAIGHVHHLGAGLELEQLGRRDASRCRRRTSRS